MRLLNLNRHCSAFKIGLKIVFACTSLVGHATYAGQIKYSCPTLARDSNVLKVTDGILQTASDSQGKTPFTPDRVSQGTVKMRRFLQAENGIIFGYTKQPAEYLLVRREAPDDAFAIPIDSSPNQPFSCFGRRGDSVELRTNTGGVRWTSLYKIDFVSDRVELLDQWPDKFPTLASSSGAPYHSKIEQRGKTNLVVMSIEEFDNSLLAILTVDQPTFALTLVSTACACIGSSSAKKALAETLLSDSHANAWSAALSVVDSWPKSAAGDAIRVAYTAASIYILGAYGIISENQKEESISRFATLFQSGDKKTIFDPLLPAAKLTLLGSVDKLDNPIATSILASAERDLTAKRFSDLEQAEFLFFKGRLQERSNDEIGAMKRFDDTVALLTVLQNSLTRTIRDSPPQSPENIIARADLDTVIRVRGPAHRELVELNISANRPVQAGENFILLLDDLPTSIRDLIALVGHACSAFDDAAGLRAADALQPNMPENEVLAGLRSTTCFQIRSLPKSSCTGGSCSEKFRWAKGSWSLLDLVGEGDCSERGMTHLTLNLDVDTESTDYVGTLEAFHFSPDSCYPLVEDRFFCNAKYKLRLLDTSENTASVIGELDEANSCSKEVLDRTPKHITITIRSEKNGFLDVDATLYGGWDPMWFSHRIERLERAKEK